MIQVKVFTDEDDVCMGFYSSGHAGMAESGQDIVCAAASVLMINTVNAIDEFTDDLTSLVTDEDDGMLDFQVKEYPSPETSLLLDAMILGLESMADNENYQEYIQLTFEEV